MAAEAVFGVEIDGLDDSWQALEVFVIVKCLDEQGRVRLTSRMSDTLSGWEALGMLDLELAACRNFVVAGYVDDGDG